MVGKTRAANERMKLSLKSMVLAGALFKGMSFLFVALMNIVMRPYGGAYLALLTSLYPGYDPVSGPLGIIVGTSTHCLPGRLPAFFSAGFIIYSQRISKDQLPFSVGLLIKSMSGRNVSARRLFFNGRTEPRPSANPWHFRSRGYVRP